MSAVVVEDLTKKFGKIVANDNISLKIEKGENIGIVGKNGAGKTTLIKQLTGELMPTSGAITILGFDVIKNPSPVKEHISVCPQEASLFYYLKVWEHIYYFARLKGMDKKEAGEATEDIISALGLGDKRETRVDELSGGLKRKVFIATALVKRSPLVFLDEPTTGLDPVSRAEMWHTIDRIKKERKDTTFIITTHYLDEMERFSERIIFIDRGKVILDGSPMGVKHKILNYDLKITVPLSMKDKIPPISGRVKQLSNVIELLVSKNEAAQIIPELLRYEGDIGISSPTLDEVFIEVANEDH